MGVRVRERDILTKPQAQMDVQAIDRPINDRIYFNDGPSFQPLIRWDNQSAAEFHRCFFVTNEPLPDNASADSGLAKFEALTVGAEDSPPVNAALRLRFTGKYDTQMGDRSPQEASGELRRYELFPKCEAFMLRVGFVCDF